MLKSLERYATITNVSKIADDILTLRKMERLTFFALSLHRCAKQRFPGAELDWQDEESENVTNTKKLQDDVVGEIQRNETFEGVARSIEDRVSIISMVPPEWFLADADGSVDPKYLRNQSDRAAVPSRVTMFTPAAVERFKKIQQLLEAKRYKKLARNSILGEDVYRKIGESMTPQADAADYSDAEVLRATVRRAMERDFDMNGLRKKVVSSIEKVEKVRKLIRQLTKKRDKAKKNGDRSKLKQWTSSLKHMNKEEKKRTAAHKSHKQRLKDYEAELNLLDRIKHFAVPPEELLCPEKDVGVGVRFLSYYLLRSRISHARRANFVASYRLFNKTATSKIVSSLCTSARRDEEIQEAAQADPAEFGAFSGKPDGHSIVELDEKDAKALRQIISGKLRFEADLPGFSPDISSDHLSAEDAESSWPLLFYFPMQPLNLALAQSKKKPRTSKESAKGDSSKGTGRKKKGGSAAAENSTSRSDVSADGSQQDQDESNDDDDEDSDALADMVGKIFSADSSHDDSDDSDEDQTRRQAASVEKKIEKKKMKKKKKEEVKKTKTDNKGSAPRSKPASLSRNPTRESTAKQDKRARKLAEKKEAKREEKKQARKKALADDADKKRKRPSASDEGGGEPRAKKPRFVIELPKEGDARSPAKETGKRAREDANLEPASDDSADDEEVDEDNEEKGPDSAARKKSKAAPTLETQVIELGDELGLLLQEDDFKDPEARRVASMVRGEVKNWDVANLHSESKTSEDTFGSEEDLLKALCAFTPEAYSTMEGNVTFSPPTVVRALGLSQKKNLVPQLPVEEIRREARSIEHVYEIDFIAHMESKRGINAFADAINGWELSNSIFKAVMAQTS